jgi:hypothetical protein
MAIYIKSTCDDCTNSVCPQCFAVYKVGGLSRNTAGQLTCVGCTPVFIGYLTAPTGIGSSLTVTCGPTNPPNTNSIEVAGVNSSGVVVAYKNAFSPNGTQPPSGINSIDISYDDCVNGVFINVFVPPAMPCPYYSFTYPSFTCPPA